MSKNVPYRPDDWVEDFRWVGEGVVADSPAAQLAAHAAYFERKYGPDAENRFIRITSAMGYFLRYDGDFDGPEYSEVSECGRMLPSHALLLGLLSFFEDTTPFDLDYDFNVEDVKEMARLCAD